jgi:hypothetical protein
LKTGSLVEAAGGLEPKLGMPLTLRLEEGPKEARLELGAAGVVVEAVLERTSEALDVFFCSCGGAG